MSRFCQSTDPQGFGTARKFLQNRGLHFLSLERTCFNVCTLAHLECPAPENACSHKRLNIAKKKRFILIQLKHEFIKINCCLF